MKAESKIITFSETMDSNPHMEAENKKGKLKTHSKRLSALFFIFGAFAFGMNAEPDTESKLPEPVFTLLEADADTQEIPLNPKTGFPEIQDIPFYVINAGIAEDCITRVQFNTGKMNYVYRNYMAGAYIELQSLKMQPVNGIVRLSAYYPIMNSFNQIPYSSTQMFLYGIELFAGPLFEANMWDYIRINWAPGLHLMYQLTDEYHLVYAGLGGQIGVELPVAKNWTIITNGNVTIDYANLGSNSIVQPFDLSFMMEYSIGFRYSRKYINKYSYIF